MGSAEEVKKIVKKFEDICIDLATYRRKVDYSEYEMAREEIISEPALKGILPDWILEKRYGNYFWHFMKDVSSNYAGRREYIQNSFAEIYNFIENGLNAPVSVSIGEINNYLRNQNVENLWKKIHSRRNDDPEGAITASRSLLETTIKYILDEFGIEYFDKEELPGLYKKVSEKLNLSPANQHEKIFKQILQGVTSVVYGFSSLRNKYGDAHGKGKNYIAPDSRHADLVINLSGSICVFLLESFNKIKTKSPS